MDESLKAALQEALEKLAPPGAKFSVEGIPVMHLVELSCDGRDKDMGYQCCGKPGHTGECFSLQKRLWFKRDS